MSHPSSLLAVVDDEPSVLAGLRHLLRACGFEAEAFTTGRAFLDSLPARRPRCVLLDIHMPGLDGYEVMAELAASDCSVPVILMTGDTDPAVSERAATAGAVALLRKPFTDVQMLEAIGVALGGGAFI